MYEAYPDPQSQKLCLLFAECPMHCDWTWNTFCGTCIVCYVRYFPCDHISSPLLFCRFLRVMGCVFFIVESSIASSLTQKILERGWLNRFMNYTNLASSYREGSLSLIKTGKAVWSKELVWGNPWQVKDHGHWPFCPLSGAALPWPNSMEPLPP